MAKEPNKKSAKKGISAREFDTEFTRIIVRHLATLPPEEQDRRIRAAQRVVSNHFRGVSSTKRVADKTLPTPFAVRTRE